MFSWSPKKTVDSSKLSDSKMSTTPTIQTAVPCTPFHQFRPDLERWEEYRDRMEVWFRVNGISDASKKKDWFITLVGSSTFSLLKNLVSPKNLISDSSITFESLIDKLNIHYEQKVI